MKRIVVSDPELRAKIISRLDLYQDVSDTLFRLSNAPSFTEAYRLQQTQSVVEFIHLLDALETNLLDSDGVLRKELKTEIVLDVANVSEHLFEKMAANPHFALLQPVQCNGQFAQIKPPASLGQMLRYSRAFLIDKTKRNLIFDAIDLMAHFHSLKETVGPSFCTDNAYVDLTTNGLLMQLPTIDVKPPGQVNATHLWISRQITSFQYLKYINTLAGRRPSVFHSQMFPWVWNYESSIERAATISQYCQNKGQEQVEFLFSSQQRQVAEDSAKLLERFLAFQLQEIDVKTAEPHHVCGPGITDLTLFCYIARRAPLSLIKKFVRPQFVAKQFSANIKGIYNWTPEEAIAEFYCDSRVFTVDVDQKFNSDPEFQHLFGTENTLSNVELGMNPEDFIKQHMNMLNGYANLHAWLDMTFGPYQQGAQAISVRNQSVPEFVQPLGMQSDTFQMFSDPHPIRQNSQHIQKSTDIISKVNINGALFQPQQSIDVARLEQDIQMLKQQSQFQICYTFMPRFSQIMFEQQKFYSLDRIYLAAFIYQIWYSEWTIKKTCFLDCLDIAYSDNKAPKPHFSGETGEVLFQLVSTIINKCKENLPLDVKELQNIEFMQLYHQQQQTKHDIFRILKNGELSIEQKLLDFQKLIDGLTKYKKESNNELIAIHLKTILMVSQYYEQKNTNSFDSESQKVIMRALAILFNNENTSKNKFAIHNFLLNANLTSSSENNETIVTVPTCVPIHLFCPICQKKSKQTTFEINSHQLEEFENQQERLKQINDIIYDQIIYAFIEKRVLHNSSLFMFSLLSKTQMDSAMYSSIIFPRSLRITEDFIYKVGDTTYNSDLYDQIINDVAYHLVQINDVQITTELLFHTFFSLCNINNDFFDYMFYQSKLSQSTIQKSAIADNFELIKQRSKNICNKYLVPILAVMKSQQCDYLLINCLIPIFIQRLKILFYCINISNLRVDGDKFDIIVLQYPIYQIINVIHSIMTYNNRTTLQSLFHFRIKINKQQLHKDTILYRLLEISRIEKKINETNFLNTFPLLFLLGQRGPIHEAICQVLLELVQYSMLAVETKQEIILFIVLCCESSMVIETESLTGITLSLFMSHLEQHIEEQTSKESLSTQTDPQDTEDDKHKFDFPFFQNAKTSMFVNLIQSKGGFGQLDTKQERPMKKQRKYWTENSIRIKDVVQQLNSKLSKSLSILVDMETLYNDCMNENHQYGIFKPYFQSKNIKISDLKSVSYIIDILQLISPVNFPAVEDKVQDVSSNQQSNEVKIREVFKCFPTNKNQQPGVERIERLSFSKYLIVSCDNVQVFDTGQVGDLQKSPLLLDYNYWFKDLVATACVGAHNSIFISTKRSELFLFDVARNSTARFLQAEPVGSQLAGLQSCFKSPVQQLVAAYNSAPEPYQTPSIAYSGGVLAVSSRGGVRLFDERVKAGLVATLSGDSQIELMRFSRNSLLVATNQALSEIDLRSLRPQTVYQSPRKFAPQFTELGFHALLEGQITSVINSQVRTDPAEQARTCCTATSSLELFSLSAKGLRRTSLRLPTFEASTQLLQREEQPIYGPLQFDSQARASAWDELFGGELVLGGGRVALIK